MNDIDYREAALINPARGKNTPNLGPVAIMVSSRLDMTTLCRLLEMDSSQGILFFNSRLFVEKGASEGVSVAGPFMGAPYAVILLENLIAWGARKILFLGWCGSISDEVKIGDWVVPCGAIADEGTSRHYTGKEGPPILPSRRMGALTRDLLDQKGLPYHQSLVWSMDAIYRETPEKIRHFQNQQAQVVEMELSAVFSVAKYRNVEAGALLVVSDELTPSQWRPGFRSKRFKQNRQTACEVIRTLCRNL